MEEGGCILLTRLNRTKPKFSKGICITDKFAYYLNLVVENLNSFKETARWYFASK